jgi:hypothetical protein
MSVPGKLAWHGATYYSLSRFTSLEATSLKQCPTCNRTYSDDTLAYCLEDGSLLTQAHDPQATQRIPTLRVTDLPPTHAAPGYYSPLPAPPQTAKNRWPIYLTIVLVVFLLGVGGIAFLLIAYSRSPALSSSANVNDSRPDENGASPTPGRKATSALAEPSPSPTIQARQLVGVWRTNVHEDNDNTEITYTFTADGRSRMLFKHSDGSTGTDTGTWQYSDGILFERFANGASGKGSIRWIDDDHFEITIIDNGIPAYSGLTRRYRRVS